jgi:hypothetical protein
MGLTYFIIRFPRYPLLYLIRKPMTETVIEIAFKGFLLSFRLIFIEHHIIISAAILILLLIGILFVCDLETTYRSMISRQCLTPTIRLYGTSFYHIHNQRSLLEEHHTLRLPVNQPQTQLLILRQKLMCQQYYRL